LFDWIKNINKKIRDLNVSVDNYKKETENQTLPTIAYVNRAKKFIDKFQFLEARDVLIEALSISEKDALVYKYIGICDEKLGNPQGAIEMYQKSAMINPQDKNIWHKLGMVQVGVKLYTDAEKSFEQADKISPMNTDIQTGWGMALLKQKKYSEALEKFTRAIKINRYNFSAMLLAAIVEIRMGKYNDAEAKLNFLMGTNPTEGAAYEYANLCRQKGDFDDAIVLAEKSVSLNQNMLPAYLLLGEIYSLKFDYINSIKWFNEAEELDLKSPLLYVAWGNALVNLYKFSEAKNMFQKALHMELDNTEAQAGMALCCAETKDFDRMHDFLTILDEKEIKHVFVVEAKGIAELAYGNVENAINLFKSAINTEEKGIYNYFRLAKCYEKLGKIDMVKDSYDKLLKFNPNFADGYFAYAKYLISLNDFKDAQRKLRKAEKLQKDNQEILNLLFYTSYILVKENICEYNIKEAILIADSIDNFEYPELRADLEKLLKEVKEK